MTAILDRKKVRAGGEHMRWSRLIWLFRQLLPLTYRSHYLVSMDGGEPVPHFTVWKMWLGRSYDIDDVVVR